MTSGERERRIEAAAKALWNRAEKRAFDNTRYPVTPWEEAHDLDRAEMREEAALSLDAADEAVPMVSQKQHARAIMNVMQLETLRRCDEERLKLKQRVRELEAAARAVLPLLGVGPASEAPSGPYQAIAQLCATLDSPSSSGEAEADA